MTILAKIQHHAMPDTEVTPDAELATVLHEIDRVCSLPFWLEDITGEMVTDAVLLSWVTVGDVQRWAGARERTEA